MKKNFLLFCLIVIYSCSRKEPFKNNAYYEQAKVCLTTKNTDSAFYYFNMAKNEYLKISDSINTAKSLVNMAIIQSDKGDFYGAIETSLEANKFLRKKQDSIVKSTLASSYNSMAIASHFLKNYDSALDYHFRALKYSNDRTNKLIYCNNIGDILITKKRFKEAKKYLEKAILIKDSNNYSRALNNLAKAKYFDNKTYNPLPEFYKALEIRQKTNNGEGQNSSFETLASYYFDKDKKLSLEYAEKMLNSAINNKSQDDQLTALQRIITLEPKNYLKNFQTYTSINDSIQTARNQAKNQFAVVRYDVEQKNAINQKLKADNFKKNIGLAALGLALIGGTFYYRKRKKRLQQEKELEVKNTQLKMSKKVHDVVANGLYHMMIDVQNNPEMDKTRILNDIEKMYEESRDISHENIAEEDFALRFINMITSYSSEEQKVFPVGYQESIWENISYNTQLELYYILREILVNMKKHSQAKLASVKFEKQENVLKIKYTDNGTGINDLGKQKGTGIQNTENRMDTIGGDITFEKNPKGGLIIELTIPIQSKHV